MYRTTRVFSCVLATFLLLPALSALGQDLRVTGERIHVIGGEGAEVAHPLWAPDGASLAFTEPGLQGIWITDLAGTTVTQLTDESAAGFGFSWSPDGEAILARVARWEGPRRFNAVKVFDVATGEARQLTDYRTTMPALPQWTPDGGAVVLPLREGVEVLEAAVEPLPAAGAPLFVGRDDGLTAVHDPASSQRVERLFDGETVLNVVASPDRSRVAFEILGGDLHVVNADGSGLVNLGRGHRPAWAPNGEWVVFMRTEDDGHHFTASDLFAARADGSGEVALTQTPDRLEMNPSWSPDGLSIAFDDHSEGAIYLLPVSF